MDSITITIAGRDYTVRTLTIAKSSAWRKAFGAEFDGLISALTNAGVAGKLEVTNFAGMGNVINEVKRTLLGSLDAVLDLVCAYAPEINQDRERIENEGYDEEIVEALVRILGLVFPLEKLTPIVNGLMAPTISKN